MRKDSGVRVRQKSLGNSHAACMRHVLYRGLVTETRQSRAILGECGFRFVAKAHERFFTSLGFYHEPSTSPISVEDMVQAPGSPGSFRNVQ